ncbi:RepB family plasmid replication initiator protein (plasmid) [Klebsiella pneumoniae]|nr:RepB family plasmid replication initiator protein [Klebsiella pneumoniae]
MLSAVRTKRYPHVHKKKKESEIKEIPEDNEILEEDALNLYTGDLVPNSNNTVQPIALMRLGLFVPTLKGTKNSSRNKSNMIDASRSLSSLKSRGQRVIQTLKSPVRGWIWIMTSKPGLVLFALWLNTASQQGA